MYISIIRYGAYIFSFISCILIGVIIGLDFKKFLGRQCLNPDFISVLVSGISSFILVYVMYAFSNSGATPYFNMACLIWLIIRCLYKRKELEDMKNGKVR